MAPRTLATLISNFMHHYEAEMTVKGHSEDVLIDPKRAVSNKISTDSCA